MACRHGIGALISVALLLILTVSSETLYGQQRVYATVDPNANEEEDPIRFDINFAPTDNIGSNIVFSQDGKTGYVVPPREPHALTRAINRLLSNSKLRQEMGRAGQIRVGRDFTTKRMVDRVEAVYRHILN